MPPFSRAVSILLLFALASLSASYGDEKPVRPSLIPEGWRMFFAKVPPGFITRITESKLAELPIDSFRVQDSTIPGTGRLFDIREWLRELGLKLPEKSIAAFQTNPPALIALAPADDIDLLETLVTPTCGGPPIMVRLTSSLVEMTVPPHAKTKTLSYRRLRSLAGSSWKELEQIQVSTKSGQRAIARKIQGKVEAQDPESPTPEESKPLLAKGETGAAIEVDPVIGPDGRTVDLSFHWARRVTRSTTPDDLEILTSTTVEDGTSVIVGQWPAELGANQGTSKRIRILALIVTAELLNTEGVPVATAFTEQLRRARENPLTK